MKIYQKILDFIPNKTIENPRILNRIGDIVGRPAENRAIMGASALLTQPYIDEHNKKVDKKTAKASKNRTIGKILAGTTVGCIVRRLTYGMVDRCTDTDIVEEKLNNLFTPRAITDCSPRMLKNKMRNYKTALATVLSLGAMLLTNFLIDMPLTTIISNKLNKRDAKKSESAEKTKNGGTTTSNTTSNTTKNNVNSTEQKKDKTGSDVSKASMVGMIATSAIGLGLLAYSEISHRRNKLPTKETLIKIPDLVTSMTNKIFNKYSNNVGAMLIHTTIIGWLASSAAQLIGIATNKKYTQEQKSFMIPQEMADAAINIGSFFLITSSIKRLAVKVVSTGKIIPWAVHERLVAHGDDINIGKYDLDLANVKYFKEIEKSYKSFLNFAGSTAAVAGGIVSSNIVTPIIRNHLASSSLGQRITNRANNQINKPKTATEPNKIQTPKPITIPNSTTPTKVPTQPTTTLNQFPSQTIVNHVPANNNSPFADFKNKITSNQKT